MVKDCQRSVLDEFEVQRIVQERFYSVLLGRSWLVSCISRWVHTSALRRRFLSLGVVDRAFTKSLSGCQLALTLDKSIDRCFEAIIVADSSNFTA